MDTSLRFAEQQDQLDNLKKFRQEFCFPVGENKNYPLLYFAGHSLGLMPKRTKELVNEELSAWENFGVEGHFVGKRPWLPYHENVTESFAKLVGAKSAEVVAMNSLTVNLHLMMVSFYQPKKKRYKILIEPNAFPSDRYAVDSQAKFHGYDPKETVVELHTRPGQLYVHAEDIAAQIKELGDSLALVMLGQCNYLSGQAFPVEKISEWSHAVGANFGLNLAHGAGNLHLQLHKWNVDFAVWCSYKYLNAGPGGIAGAFVHERHLKSADIPRFTGWWGHDKNSRFKMGPVFSPIPTAEAWQLSNPPILQLAALRSSMDLFDEAGMESLSLKSKQISAYFYQLLQIECARYLEVVTPEKPEERGSMLCVRLKAETKAGQLGKQLIEKLLKKNCIVDFREPNIFRMTPTALYGSFVDVYRLVTIFKQCCQELEENSKGETF